MLVHVDIYKLPSPLACDKHHDGLIHNGVAWVIVSTHWHCDRRGTLPLALESFPACDDCLADICADAGHSRDRLGDHRPLTWHEGVCGPIEIPAALPTDYDCCPTDRGFDTAGVVESGERMGVAE